MRTVTALFVLVLAPAALAQPCDPAQTDEACADTTDWRRYFPLAVGNQWQYRDAFAGEPVTHWSWTITGETEVGGQAYFELERCYETADGSATCADPVLLRYDDEHSEVVRRRETGERGWQQIPCRLDVAFNFAFAEGGTGYYECTRPGEQLAYGPARGAYGVPAPFPRTEQVSGADSASPDEVALDTRKTFTPALGLGGSPDRWTMFAGLGLAERQSDIRGGATQLVYAYVDGRQAGTPAFASCDPADAAPGSGIVCPDTTDWRRYLPLEVGNQWQYHVDRPIETDYDHGTEIVGETEIDGERYFLARVCTKPRFDDLACRDPLPIRYDESSRTVVRRYINTNSGEVEFGQFQVSDYAIRPCPLDAPFGQSEQDCSGFGEGLTYSVSGAYDAGYEGIGDTRKEFDDLLQGSIALVAGLGPIGANNVDSSTREDLLYARIGGEEVGTPAFVFPTADEPGAAQPVATAFTEVYPNPSRGAVQAQYALADPQVVVLELIDLLGRRVRSADLGRQAAGAHDVRIDTGGLRAGLYVLRLRGDAGAEATRRVVIL